MTFTLSHFLVRLLSVVTVGTVLRYVRMFIGWLDRHSGAPIMRERINAGSEQFFAAEMENWGKTEVDSILTGEYGDV